MIYLLTKIYVYIDGIKRKNILFLIHINLYHARYGYHDNP